MRVDLGTAHPHIPGYDKYVDICPCPGVPEDKMIVADLSVRFPFETSSVAFFRAHDIIEHLPNKILTMNEMWRALKPNGVAEIVVPTTNGSGAWQDPTHCSYWNRRSFLYYEAGNPYRERFAKSYGIAAAFKILSDKVEDTCDGEKLTIVLKAVK
jgi:SAM-dependent methyltransferase